MKIDVYSNMYNEELILPYWLRHYETFANRIFIWDGGSTDKTLEMLKKHPKVTLLPRGKYGHCDEYYVACLYPQYEKYSRGVSDWVIIADADEFVYHPHLRKVLEKAMKAGVQVIQCAGNAMISDNFPTTNGQIYDEIKMGLPNKFESKWTIHSSNIHIRHHTGRHGPPTAVMDSVYKRSAGRGTGIKLLHYRYIGKEYIESRERKNIEQVNIAYPGNTWGFTLEVPRRCPDGSSANIFEWLTEHKGEEVNVIDT